MSVYSKTKFLSKAMIVFAVLTVMISGGGFLIANNQIGADTNNQLTASIRLNGADPQSIVASGLTGSAFTQDLSNFNKNNNDVEYFDDDTYECQPVNKSSCFVLTVGGWPKPAVDSESNRPAWDFLKQAYDYFSANGTTEEKRLAKLVKDRYAAAAWNAWDEVNINKDHVLIASQPFFEALSRNNVDVQKAQEKYCEPTGHCEIQIADDSDNFNSFLQLNLSDDYLGAKADSVWLLGMDFVLGSAIPVWTDAGVDLQDEINFLSDHREKYLIRANWSEKTGQAITFSHPPEIIISSENGVATSANEFTIKIDQSKITPEEGMAYKYKLYVKPLATESNEPAILIGPFGISAPDLSDPNATIERKFGWDAILNGSYDPAPSDSGLAEYQTTYPQKYKMTVMLNKYDSDDTSDGGTNIEKLESSLQTLTSVNGGTAKGEGDYFSISASPSSPEIGTPVNIKVDVKSNVSATDPNDKINSADIFACIGRKSVVIPSDFGSCSPKGKFDPQQLSTYSLSWDTSGSSLGYHTVAIKGYSDGYPIGDSVAGAEVALTNSDPSLNEKNEPSSYLTDLLDFGNLASEQKTGSSITSIIQLAERIRKWVVGFIGIIAFIAILVAGILYMTAGGNEDQTKKAKKAITFAIIGLVVAFFSYAAMLTVVDIIKKILTLQSP
ncbi:hypothetical protein A2215_02280 [Candidatus Berkelbacteria bacterium RIFOXYA2_FULL_43_10]|uniref:Uncharacterized protein n=1 Tax=Candidatus Berkelbacteria bacterium RIFOXYA2_FULL_43_10 TaxID=1797472 RepID=A0A1F5E3S3_9BACT|nr:MAG: hypothetical protein A2215_02280 [Candidatus Berkelbacteria bacterium RIFOXYA2_FULL_43_10]